MSVITRDTSSSIEQSVPVSLQTVIYSTIRASSNSKWPLATTRQCRWASAGNHLHWLMITITYITCEVPGLSPLTAKIHRLQVQYDMIQYDTTDELHWKTDRQAASLI